MTYSELTLRKILQFRDILAIVFFCFSLSTVAVSWLFLCMNIVSCKSEVIQENFPREVYTAAGMLLGIESPQIVHYIEKAFF